MKFKVSLFMLSLSLMLLLATSASADSDNAFVPYKPGYEAVAPDGTGLPLVDKQNPEKGYKLPGAIRGKVITYQKVKSADLKQQWADRTLDRIKSQVDKLLKFVKKHKVVISISLAGSGMALMGLWWLQDKLRNKYKVMLIVPQTLTEEMQLLVGRRLMGDVGESITLNTFSNEDDANTFVGELTSVGLQAWVEKKEESRSAAN